MPETFPEVKIPITPEILKKNGFTVDKEYWSGLHKYEYKQVIADGVHITNEEGLGFNFDAKLEMSLIYRVEENVFGDLTLYSFSKHGHFEIKNYTTYNEYGRAGVIYLHELQRLIDMTGFDKKLIP